MNRKPTLLLRTATLYEPYQQPRIGWAVVDGKTGRTVYTFYYRKGAIEYLTEQGYAHTDNMAGESRAEVWTRAE